MHLTPHRRQAWARTHQHIDDHAVLHRDSFQEEFFGPILRLIPEDIQFFIAVPWSWQEFWLLITGTWLRRHKGWEQKDLGLRTQNYKGPTILPIPNPVPHITDVCSGMHRKSEVWEPALSLSYLVALATQHRRNLSAICSLGWGYRRVAECLSSMDEDHVLIPRITKN